MKKEENITPKIIQVSSFKSKTVDGCLSKIKVYVYEDGVSLIEKSFLSNKELGVGVGFELVRKIFNNYYYVEVMGLKYNTLMAITKEVNIALTKNKTKRKDIKL